MRLTRCPCCNTELSVKVPIVSLERNIAAFGDRSVKLSPTEAEIAYLLADKAPNVLRFDTMMIKVWPHLENKKIAHTVIAHVRRKMRTIGCEVINDWKAGYRLECA